MAQNTAPFIITTAIDTKGLEAGLTQITAKLKAYKPGAAANLKFDPVDPKKIKEGGNAVQDLGKKTKTAGGHIGTATTNVKNFNKAAGQTKNALADVSRRVFVWGSMAALIFGAFIKLKEFYDLTIDVNSAMAELRKVLPRATDFEFLKGEALDLSISFGVAPLEVFEILKKFSQAGLVAENAISATRTALLAMNTAGADTVRAFNAIIAANKIFGIAFADSEKVIDKVMRIQADFAVTASDLIDAITAIGPAVKALGGNIDDLFANIAALAEASRVSGKEAANSLKRVFSRIVSEEGIRALGKLGVAVFSSAEGFRSIRDILKDLSVALKTASQVEKQNIAIVLAQVRQYTKFQALLGNMDRAFEALEKSQKASGDAFRANQDVLDTYAKRSQIASNQISKFAESVIGSSGGIADSLTRVKIGVGGAIDAVGSKLPKTLTSLAFSFGVASIAVKGFRSVMPQMTRETLKAAAKTLHKEQAVKKLNRSLFNMTRLVKRATPAITFWGVGILGAAAGLAILAGAYEFFTRDAKRRDRIIEASTKRFIEWKAALQNINFASIANVNVEAKFSAIKKTIEELIELSKDGNIAAEDAVEAFSKLLFGTSAENITAGQLEEIVKLLQETKRGLEEISLIPFHEGVGKFKAELNSTLNDLVKFVGTTDQALVLRLEPAADQEGFKAKIKKAFENVDLLGINFEQFFTGANFTDELGRFIVLGAEFNRMMGEIAETGNTVRDTLNLPPVTGKEQFLVGLNVEAAITGIASYQTQLDSLKNTTVELTEAQVKLQGQLENQIGKAAKSAALDILSLAGANDKILRAAQDAGVVLSNVFESDKGRRNARALQTIYEEVNIELQRMVDNGLLNITQAGKLASAIGGVLPGLTKALEVTTKLFAVTFNTAAVTSSIKKSNATIIAAFAEQFVALRVLANATRDLPGVFSVNKEAISTVDSAIRRVISGVQKGAKEIADLEIQWTAVNAAIQTGQGYAARDNKELQKMADTLDIINTKLILKRRQHEANTQHLEAQLKFFARIKYEILAGVKEEQKRVAFAAKWASLVKEVLGIQIQLNNLQFQRDPLKAVEANAGFYREINDAQKEGIRLRAASGNIEQKRAIRLTSELEAQEKISSLLRPIKGIQKEIKQAYDAIGSSVSDIESTIENIIADQDKWFERLQETGGLRNLFADLFSGITDVMANTDAQVIAQAIGDVSEGVFIRLRSDVETMVKAAQKAMKDAVDDEEFKKALRSPLEDAGGVVGQIIEDGHLRGARLFMDDIIARTPEWVKEVYQALQATARGEEIDLRSTTEGSTGTIPGQTQALNPEQLKKYNELQDLEKAGIALSEDQNKLMTLYNTKQDEAIEEAQKQTQSLDDLKGIQEETLALQKTAEKAEEPKVLVLDLHVLNNALWGMSDALNRLAITEAGVTTGSKEGLAVSNAIDALRGPQPLSLEEAQKYDELASLMRDFGVVLTTENAKLFADFQTRAAATTKQERQNLKALENIENWELDRVWDLLRPPGPGQQAAQVEQTEIERLLKEIAEARKLSTPLSPQEQKQYEILQHAINESGRTLSEKYEKLFSEFQHRTTKGTEEANRLAGLLVELKNTMKAQETELILDIEPSITPLLATQVDTLGHVAAIHTTSVHSDALLDHIEANTREAAEKAAAAELEAARSAAQLKLLIESAARRIGTLVSQAVGLAIAKSVGTRPEDVKLGSDVGQTLGGILGPILKSSAEAKAEREGKELGLFFKNLDIVSLIGGGLIGSIFGGLLGRSVEEPEEEQVQILSQIEKNTAQLVERLTPEIFNAPAGFVLPAGQGVAAGGITIQNNFNVSGGLDNGTIDTLTQQLEDVYSRSPRALSNLR